MGSVKKKVKMANAFAFVVFFGFVCVCVWGGGCNFFPS